LNILITIVSHFLESLSKKPIFYAVLRNVGAR